MSDEWGVQPGTSSRSWDPGSSIAKETNRPRYCVLAPESASSIFGNWRYSNIFRMCWKERRGWCRLGGTRQVDKLANTECWPPIGRKCAEVLLLSTPRLSLPRYGGSWNVGNVLFNWRPGAVSIIDGHYPIGRFLLSASISYLFEVWRLCHNTGSWIE